MIRHSIDKDKYFRKNPAEAPIVTEIFNRYADGETILDIINDLSGKGLTNRGQKFTYHFINGLLKNRRYIGEYRFKDVVNDTAIPPLTTEEIFEICRQRLEANRHKCGSYRKIEDKFILTGKIFCGYCGTTVSGTGGTGRNKVYHYYQCNSAKKRHCSQKAISKKRLEDLVIKVVLELLNDVPLVKRISKTCFALQKKKSTKLSALQKEQKQNKKELDNLLTAIKAGLFTKSTKTELERLENQQEAIEAEIAKEKIHNSVVTAEQIEAWILGFAKIRLNTPEQRQKLVDFFVNSIYLYDDKFVIMLNFKGGEKVIRFDDLNEGIKKEHPMNECSSLLMIGDPYGN